MKETEQIINDMTITKGTIWYAEINGRIFKNNSGHAFFWRKGDLIRSLKRSDINKIVLKAALEYFAAFPEKGMGGKERQKRTEMFWNSYVGEGPKFPCQIKCIDLEDFD